MFLLLFFISYVGTRNTPEEYPPYLYHSPSPTGTKAFYTYIEEEFEEVRKWNNYPTYLPKTDENMLLIMIEPQLFLDSENQALYKAYLEAGNTILLFIERPSSMFDVAVSDSEDFVEKNEMANVPIYDRHGEKYNGKLTSEIRLEKDREDEVLLEDEFGGIIALKRSYGDGSLIVAPTPHWLTNETILELDHVALILYLIDESHRGGPIVFDEYIHGKTPTFVTVYPKLFLLFIFQGAFIFLLWLWYKGKRFGPIFTLREETVRFGDEAIKALASWNLRQRNRNFRDSLHIQANYVKRMLLERWGIPYHTEWPEMASLLEDKWTSITQDEMREFLNGITNILQKEYMSKKEYLYWSKRLDMLRKEVDK